jgi:hypothetical protein
MKILLSNQMHEFRPPNAGLNYQGGMEKIL